MVFSSDEKAVIKNDFLEKGWNANRICTEHPTKNWDRVSVYRLLKRFQETGTMERKQGSGRPRTVCTEENENLVEQLICSQEDNPGSHMSPREIEKHTGINRSVVRRIVKSRGLRQFKRLKTPMMSAGTKERRTTRAGLLAERFGKNRMIEKCVFQDEKDFTLDIPINHQNSRVYGSNRKSDIPAENLFHPQNRQSQKIMVSACVSWKGATKPFFVNDNGLKVNGKSYKKHLSKELLPNVQHLLQHERWIFLQDSAPSHRATLVQELLKEKLNRRFVKHTEWPPSSPDCNPLDYHFWDKVKVKVYEDRFGNPFKDIDELKRKIRKVWPKVASDIKEIRKALKQFVPRLNAVAENEGNCIKMHFG